MIAKIDSLGDGFNVWYREAKTKRSPVMITKKISNPDRIRRINGGFSFIPHRFLTDGFLENLSQCELFLYIFLVLAADRHGLSFYSYERICSLLQLSLKQYIEARNGLIRKDLIAFDSTLFQVLELPAVPIKLQRGSDARPAQPASHRVA
jgi:hypothetical protein